MRGCIMKGFYRGGYYKRHYHLQHPHPHHYLLVHQTDILALPKESTQPPRSHSRPSCTIYHRSEGGRGIDTYLHPGRVRVERVCVEMGC